MQVNADPFQQEIIVSVTRKGQITIPAQARRHLSTGTQRKLAVVIEPNGTLTLKQPKYPTIESLAGAVPALQKSMSWKEIEQVIADDRADAYLAKNK